MNQPQSEEPVVVCMGRALVAFDPSGVVRWNFIAEANIQRLFRVGASVLALSGQVVVCVDLASGRLLGTVDVAFQPDAGLVCGTDLILAEGTAPSSETPRVVCVSADGAIKWRATVEARGAENILRTYGNTGARTGETRFARSGYRAGILHGASVAQPDRD